MKIAAKVLGGVALASAALAAPVQAQTSYYTQGFFSSPTATCNNPFNPALVGPLAATCTGAGFTLTFSPATQLLIGDGSTTSLGEFLLTGSGAVTVPANTVLFTLAIKQTAPTVGTGTTDGYITGRVETAPPGTQNFSSLIWVPDEFVNINSTIYRLIFDNRGFAAGIGLAIPINDNRGIDATITTVPEPGSMALVATGLLGIFGIARRRMSTKA
jgi:hypothetical protein